MARQDMEMIDAIVGSIDIDGLEIFGPLGSGYFGSVFEGVMNGSQKVAIKVIPDNDSALEHERKVLRAINGCPHCVKIIDIENAGFPIIVMEYNESMHESEIRGKMTVSNLRNIVHAILECLDSVHKKGVVHQDVKITNISVSKDFSSIWLIDWGCAHFISNNMSPYVGSRLIRSPEMLIGAKNYKTAGDVWAVGVLILDILTNGKLPWNATNDKKQLIEMTKLFGGKAILDYSNKLAVPIQSNVSDEFSDEITLVYDDFYAQECAHLRDENLIDLMKSLLTVDMDNRPSAEQALQHKFFQANLS